MKRARTVLIVTDAEDIHSGIGWLLQRRGYRVIEVSGQAAPDTIRHEAPALILIDTDHPLSEGRALSHSLRAQSDIAQTQVVIVTTERQLNSQIEQNGKASEYIIDRNDSAGIMELLAALDTTSRQRPLSRAQRA